MICVSLGNTNFDNCVKALSLTEFAEIRIDLLNFSEGQFATLFSMKYKTIATCRAEKFNDSERMELLKKAILSGAGYVDIEFEAKESYRNELIEFAKQNNAKTILSYHNYDKTPDLQELNKIVELSKSWGVDYVKLATYSNSKEDNARILGLYDKYSNLIAFCMGQEGSITRVTAPVLGSLFTFGALTKELATAPGQYTVEELKNIYELL